MVDAFQHLQLAGEILVESPPRDPRRLQQVVDRGLGDSLAGEHRDRRELDVGPLQMPHQRPLALRRLARQRAVAAEILEYRLQAVPLRRCHPVRPNRSAG